jgi:hypothetical protein
MPTARTEPPARQGPVYFYCQPQGAPDKAAYQHEIVCIAEGLRELGVPFYSNTTYWRLSPGKDDYLFTPDPNHPPQNCRIVVMNSVWFDYGGKIPAELFAASRQYRTVYVDQADGIKTRSWDREFRRFDLILKSHYNRRSRYPSNLRPWAFGLSNRILKATAAIGEFAERRNALLINYRHQHDVRRQVRGRVLPALGNILPLDETVDELSALGPEEQDERMLWEQTGRRHHASYYRRLLESAACACFGGLLLPVTPSDKERLKKAVYALMKRLGLISPRLIQWDSWRFWEALAAGCVAFHLDLAKYGVCLPVMPENWKHYVGIDLDQPAADFGRLTQEPECLERIAHAGAAWARQHYSPRAVASRFLDTVAEFH